jgi:hypothetical protein
MPGYRLCAGDHDWQTSGTASTVQIVKGTCETAEVALLLPEHSMLLSLVLLCARAPAPDIMEFKEQILSACPEQVRLGVGLVPVNEPTFIEPSVNEADWLWTSIRLVNHELTVAKVLCLWRQPQRTVSFIDGIQC